MSLERPSWVPEKYKNGLLEGGLRLVMGGFTAPVRGLELLPYIEDFVRERDQNDINYLEVGVGNMGARSSSYEPYFIAALFESLDIDYRGLIVDRDQRSLARLDRDQIFHQYDPWKTKSADRLYEEKNWAAWNNYLTLTGQNVQLALNDDQIPSERVFIKRDIPQLQRGGLAKANVPAGFLAKLQSGEVQRKQADIAHADLSPYGPFDLITCMYVFKYLSVDGEKMAMFNMASNMSDGGMMIIDDLQDFSIQDEWLSRDKLRDLKLEVDHRYEKPKRDEFHLILRKY